MLVSDIEWTFTKQNKVRTWKLKAKDVIRKFQNDVNNRLENDANLISETVEDNWKHLKINLLKDTELSCGLSKKRKMA